MEIAEGYRRASDWTAQVIAGIRSDQMGDATPCPDWDVRALASHIVGANVFFAAGVRGEDVSGGLPDNLLGADPVSSYRASVDAVLASMDTEGAGERLLPTRVGELPGSVVLGIMMTEQLLHGWDLATATGQYATLDPELVAMADGLIRSWVDAGQASGAYAAPVSVAEDASDQDKLITLVGRHP